MSAVMASLSFSFLFPLSFSHSSFHSSPVIHIYCNWGAKWHELVWGIVFLHSLSLSLSPVCVSPFHIFFILFPETVSPVWVKIPMYLLPMANKSFECSVAKKHTWTHLHLYTYKALQNNIWKWQVIFISNHPFFLLPLSIIF